MPVGNGCGGVNLHRADSRIVGARCVECVKVTSVAVVLEDNHEWRCRRRALYNDRLADANLLLRNKFDCHVSRAWEAANHKHSSTGASLAKTVDRMSQRASPNPNLIPRRPTGK